jgi:hypothetical protein
VSRWIIGNNTITYQIGLNGTRYTPLGMQPFLCRSLCLFL